MKQKRKLYIWLERKVNDCWVGIFWKTSKIGTFPNAFGTTIDFMSRDIWICIVPMLPIHIAYTWEDAQGLIRRKQALDEIAQISQDMGLYD